MPGTPLFSAEEEAEWEARRQDALRERPGDDVHVRSDGSKYNSSTWPRTRQVARSKKIARRNKMRARPEDILAVLLVGFQEKGSVSMSPEEIWETGLGDRLKAANTPENRRHVYEIIQGLQQVPRSWATSATTRFFRGTGKQAKPPWSEKPGAGLLSKDYGWTTDQTNWYVSLFYNSYFFDGIFFSDDSPDPYGAEGREVEEEGGDRWAATTKERDDSLFTSLLKLLEEQGLADAVPKPKVKKVKPRKAKTWKIGDKINSRNLRDLPQGALIKLEHGDYPWGWRKEEKFTAKIKVREMVFEGRETGTIKVRPVVEGRAFGKIDFSSSLLYKQDWQIPEAVATYEGQWEGETINVKVDKSSWGKTFKRIRYVTGSLENLSKRKAQRETP